MKTRKSAPHAPLPRRLVSGERIPVGTASGRGPISMGLGNLAFGAARITGGPGADLFVGSLRHTDDAGLFLLPRVGTSDDGIPVFGQRQRVGVPFEDSADAEKCALYENEGWIVAVWLIGGALQWTIFDTSRMEFVPVGSRISVDVPKSLTDIGVLPNDDGSLEIFLGVAGETTTRPLDVGSSRDPDYMPFDGSGIWRFGHSWVTLYHAKVTGRPDGGVIHPRQIARTERESLSFCGIFAANLGSGHERDIICGSRMGIFPHYAAPAESGEPVVHNYASDGEGNALRAPIILGRVCGYPNDETGLTDIMAGGEGAFQYYRCTGRFTDRGAPIFDDAKLPLEENALLYAHTLSVNTAVDWNGNGVTDIVSGTSEGYILLFRNAGTNAEPAFLSGEPLEAGGRMIQIQAGYRGSIQGPGEARWGYTCPTVFDWNDNGLPDIVMSDITAQFSVLINRGTRTEPVLDHPHPLYCDGLDLHGTWRVQPGLARFDDRVAMVILDDDDEFHLYWKIDDFNLEDGGKLTLEDGSYIRANTLWAGGTGRSKISLVDWFGDGTYHLMVGTPRHGSVPEPEKGLPASLGLPGAAVLLLKNVGTNHEPVYQWPELVKFRGKPVFFGQHACGPTLVDFGGEHGPDLIVGEQEGRFAYFAREDITP